MSNFPGAVFSDLNHEQANGVACAVCRAGFDLDSPRVPVGHSRSTGEQVYACPIRCAPLVGGPITAAGSQLALEEAGR